MLNLDKNTLLERLRLPAIAAPMFIVSNVDLVVAAAKSGIIGTMPSQNARDSELLDKDLTAIQTALADHPDALWGINVITHSSFARSAADIEVIVKHCVPIVISALGSPRELVERVHAYGGLVFADVINMHFAQKSIDAGVDGLILICNGAGGHTGSLSPFAFVAEVRKRFDGIVILGGAISSGGDILTAQTLGADLAYMGTRFIATAEANASTDYKDMIIDCAADDVVQSNKITGVNANWLKPALAKAKEMSAFEKLKLLIFYKLKRFLPKRFKKVNLSKLDSAKVAKRWRDIFSAGQGVGAIDNVLPVAELVDNIEVEYRQKQRELARLLAKN